MQISHAHVRTSFQQVRRTTNGLPYVKEYPNFLEMFSHWIAEGKISIKIHRKYPLAEAAQAHAAFENREVIGRVLLIP